MKNNAGFQTIALTRIHESTTNPRSIFDESKLAELAASLRTQGLIQPITVRPNSDGYEIVAGARRFRAAQLAELTELPVRIVQLSDEQSLEWQIIENSQRVAFMRPGTLFICKRRVGPRIGHHTKSAFDQVRRASRFCGLNLLKSPLHGNPSSGSNSANRHLMRFTSESISTTASSSQHRLSKECVQSRMGRSDGIWLRNPCRKRHSAPQTPWTPAVVMLYSLRNGASLISFSVVPQPGKAPDSQL
jgi:hypothetical protein